MSDIPPLRIKIKTKDFKKKRKRFFVSAHSKHSEIYLSSFMCRNYQNCLPPAIIDKYKCKS